MAFFAVINTATQTVMRAGVCKQGTEGLQARTEDEVGLAITRPGRPSNLYLADGVLRYVSDDTEAAVPA
jgi:hypothetical protein